MAARGHEVGVVCRRGGALESRVRAAGLTVHPLPFRGDFWPPAVLALSRALRATRPGVLQLHDPHAVTAGLLASRLAGGPPAVATRRVDFPLRGRASRWKYRGCRRVIAVSRAIAAVLERDGLPAERLRLVYEGVPDRAPAVAPDEARRTLAVPEGWEVVGNVAALTDHKDHATLIEAAALVLRAAPRTLFLVAGEGELRPRLEAHARARGLGEDRFRFLGFRDDLEVLMPAFTVFCLSSRLEGLGTSLLDAMCLGLPVVATAAGGIPEAVEDGVTGRLAPARNPQALAAALIEVLGDAQRRRAMGAAGRRRFRERFIADRMVEDTLRVLEEV
jgi:glycosyltransferase involved in cell wall biosynthesis